MNKFIKKGSRVKKIKLNAIFILLWVTILSGCNGGGGGSSDPTPNHSPTPSNLPNVFSLTSVKDLQFDILKLDNSAIVGNLNRAKVAGHVSYKIKLTNPNSFALSINKIKFENESSYLFIRNTESDNCFNQSWYLQSASGTTLAMPSDASCSFYTTSPWIQSYTSDMSQAGAKYRHDFVNYTATAAGFGFSRTGTYRTSMHCESGCYPTGTQASLNDGTNNTINSKYYTWPISRGIFKDYPQASFIQDGNSVINLYLSGGYITMAKYPVAYDDSQLDLLPTTTVTPSVVYSGSSATSLNNFVFSSSGLQGLMSAELSFQGASILSLRDYIGAIGSSTFLSGLNNTLYSQDSYGIEYLRSDDSLKWITALSANLPQVGTLYGADVDGNLIIKVGSTTSCYLKNVNYASIPALSNLSDIQTQNIRSSKYLYSKNAAANEQFYNLDQQVVTNPFSYQVDATDCQTIPVILASESQIIITEKYTAVATGQGYFFVSPANTSAGENDDSGVN